MGRFEWDKLGVREKWGLAFSLVLVGVLLTDRLVVSTVARRLSELDERIAEQEETLSLSHGVLRSAPAVDAAFAAIEPEWFGDASAAEQVDTIKGRLDDMARAAGVALVSMEHRSPVVTPSYTNYIIEVAKFEADSDAVLRFLDAIRVSPGLLRVQKLVLKPGNEPGMLEGALVISRVVVARG